MVILKLGFKAAAFEHDLSANDDEKDIWFQMNAFHNNTSNIPKVLNYLNTTSNNDTSKWTRQSLQMVKCMADHVGGGNCEGNDK